MRCVIKAVVLGTSLMVAGAAHAAWPERPVTVVVPFAPVGIADVVARLAAEWLQNALRQPFVIENQGAAGASLRSSASSRRDPTATRSSPRRSSRSPWRRSRTT